MLLVGDNLSLKSFTTSLNNFLSFKLTSNGMSFVKRFLVFVVITFVLLPFFALAEEQPASPLAYQDGLKITLFYGEECPHCHDEIDFLKDLKKEFPNLEIEEYEIWHNTANAELFKEVAEGLDLDMLMVPLTIIGDEYLLGFDNPENSGEKIRAMIGGQKNDKEERFSIPFFGEINIKDFSLPVITVILGGLDGFNPCSMWSLFVLLTLVIATGSRKKIWLMGGVFILTSAISYFLFMSAWLNAFVFLEYLVAVRIIIGFVAIGAGVMSIRGFYKFKQNV